MTYDPEMSGSSHPLLIEEAIAGLGVALASSVLTADDLDTGRLVRPFYVSYPVQFCYWLVCPESMAHEPKSLTFREWLLAEVTASTRIST